MAVAGSLTYDTKIDKNGFEKGLSSLENTANKAMKGFVAGLAAITTGVVAVGTASIKSYADLEQNIGGVETLFKGSADKVKKYANEAYKTAGISANKYMETTTSFAASLLKSLKGDTEKAAEVSNMALIDMADNSNKMGTAMESIQYAYQGFAKQNYTMLDNLKLGYGGTKEEMQRLLKDAQKLTGVKYDISNLNDIFQAIHVIQGELGITGTTAKEAEETISGSINSLKASWDNFLNGSGDLDTVVENAKTAFNNIWKAVKEQLPRIAKDIVDLLPEGFIKTVKIITPIALSLGTALGIIWGYFKMVAIVQTITKAFGVLNKIMAANPILLIVAAIAALVVAFVYLWNTSEGFRNFWIGLWENIKLACKNAIDKISQFFTKTIPELFSKLVDWFTQLPQKIYEVFWDFFQPIEDAFWDLYEKVTAVIEEMIQNVKKALKTGWENIVIFFTETIPQWIQNVIDWFANLPYMIGYHVGQILGNIVQFGLNIWNWITNDLPQIIQSIIDWFAQLPGKIWEWLCNVVSNIIEWGQNLYNTTSTWFSSVINSIVNWFAQLPGRIWQWLCNVVNNIIQWGQNVYNTASSWISNTINNIINWFAQLPSRVWTWLSNTIQKVINWGRDMANRGRQGAQDLFNNVVNTIKGLPSRMLEIGKNIVQGLWNGIVNAKNWIVGKVKSFAKGILDGMKNALGIHSPSKVFRDQVGKFIPQGIAVGIEADTDSALKAIDNMNDDIMNEMNRAVAFETGSINANASVKSNNSMLNVIQAKFNIDGSVNIDGQKAGRIITPYMAKTLRTGGAY